MIRKFKKWANGRVCDTAVAPLRQLELFEVTRGPDIVTDCLNRF